MKSEYLTKYKTSKAWGMFGYALGISLLFLLGGCSKLDEKPDSSVLTGNYFTNRASVETAVTGAYSWLGSTSTQHYLWGYLIDDSRSDDSYSAGNSKEITNLEYFNMATDNFEPIFRAWSDCYKGIGSCNLVLDNIGQVTDPALTDALRNQYIGEAKFLRAFHYFNLVRLYGGVPLVLSTVDPDINKKRSSADDVYASIQADLMDAENKLPVTYPNMTGGHSKATQGAAQALLAKVYAQQLKWQDCLNECNKVLPGKFGGTGTAGYDLLAAYDNLFDNHHWGNVETIFEVMHQSGSYGTFAPGLLIPNGLTDDQTWTKFIAPSHSLINAYKNAGDTVRFKTNIIFQNVTTAAHPWPFAANEAIPFVWKCGRELQGWSSNQNTIFLRLADIVLLKAEAMNQTSQTTQAVLLVNQIRNRANLAPIVVTSQSDVALAILNERRLEMAFEGDRLYSLIRFGGAQYTIDAIKQQKDGSNNSLASFYNLLTADRLLYPIPQKELDVNKNLTQNPGY
jgi:hypothetical protein